MDHDADTWVSGYRWISNEEIAGVLKVSENTGLATEPRARVALSTTTVLSQLMTRSDGKDQSDLQVGNVADGEAAR